MNTCDLSYDLFDLTSKSDTENSRTLYMQIQSENCVKSLFKYSSDMEHDIVLFLGYKVFQ